MGVHGLWGLLQPVGRPVTLESLEGKVLAIDVSIWLHQSSKGMRDKFGNPLPNAHLLSLFHRVCKLLHYRIRPVFVFDGGVPQLKRQTLAARRNRRDEAQLDSSKTAKKLLTTLLKHHAVSSVLGSTPTAGGRTPAVRESPATAAGGAGGPQSGSADIFQLPPLPESDRPIEEEDEEAVTWEARQAHRDTIYSEFQDLNEVDFLSEDFKSLPPEVQHEILTDLKDARKKNSWAKIDQLPAGSDDFSSYQLAKLMTQNKLSQRIYDVRKEMNARSSGDIALTLTGTAHDPDLVQSQRVVSEDASHYILIKGLNKYRADDENSSTSLVARMMNPNSNGDENVDVNNKLGEERTLSAREVTSESDAAQSSLNDSCVINTVKDTLPAHNPSIQGSTSIGEASLTSDDVEKPHSGRISVDRNVIRIDSDSEDALTDTCKNPSVSSNSRENVTAADDDASSLNGDRGVADGGLMRETVIIKYPPRPGESSTQSSVAPEDVLPVDNSDKGKTELITKASGHAVNGSPHSGGMTSNPSRDILPVSEVVDAAQGAVQADDRTTPQSLDAEKAAPAVNKETGEESDDSDDGFLEVTIDPNNIVPDDDLFPASIFAMATDAATQHVSRVEPSAAEEVIDIEDEADAAQQEDSLDGFRQVDNEFEGLSQEELVALQGSLEQQGRVLQQEKGKQDRLGQSITDQMHAEAQELLELFGVPYVISPTEAEAQCAYLDLTNQTQGSITDDSDVWLFGGQRVYKNFFNQNKHVEFYRASDIQSQFLLDRPRLIEVALLCGSDYTEGIPGVGPVTAMEIVGEFPGEHLERLKALKTWWDIAQKQVKAPVETKLKSKLRHFHIKEGFPSRAVVEAYLEPSVDHSQEAFSWGMPNLDLLRTYADEKFGWSQKKADESLLPMLQQLNQRGAQTPITSFFTGEIGERQKLKSKRVKRILTRMRTTAREGSVSTVDTPKISQTTTSTVATPKGKATRGRGAKNRLISATRSRGSGAGAGGGGWLSTNSGTSQSLPQELNLSESSSASDSDNNPDFGSSDDEIYRNIDLNAAVAMDTAAVASTNRKSTRVPSESSDSDSASGRCKVDRKRQCGPGDLSRSEKASRSSRGRGRARGRGRGERGGKGRGRAKKPL